MRSWSEITFSGMASPPFRYERASISFDQVQETDEVNPAEKPLLEAGLHGVIPRVALVHVHADAGELRIGYQQLRTRHGGAGEAGARQ